MQTFTVPAPPSTNSLFTNVPGKGRVKTDRYRTWLQAAAYDVILDGNRLRSIGMLTCPVSIEITLGNVRGDLDNRAKPIIDLLVRTGVIKDDDQVEELHMIRARDVKQRAAEIVVRPLAP